jgi:L-cysteine:1D-myo-inositol 2-amino-2-deoxy-alpha-D-glucopyranoside ligase
VALDAGPDAGPLLGAVRRQLADDLDTVNALAAVDHWAAEALQRRGRDAGAPPLVRKTVDALLGIAL